MKLGPKVFPKLIPKQTDTHTLSNSATSLLNSRRRHHSGNATQATSKTTGQDRNGVGRRKRRRTTGSRKLVSQQQRRHGITTRSRRNGPKSRPEITQTRRRRQNVCSLQRPGKKCSLNGPKLPEPRHDIRGLILAWGGVEKLEFSESCKSVEKIGGKILRRYDVFKMKFWDDLKPKNFYESWRLV